MFSVGIRAEPLVRGRGREYFLNVFFDSAMHPELACLLGGLPKPLPLTLPALTHIPTCCFALPSGSVSDLTSPESVV